MSIPSPDPLPAPLTPTPDAPHAIPSAPAHSAPGSHPTQTDELIGRTVNDTYKIEAMVGEGGMGRVYQARHTRIPQKKYALKVLHPEFARDPEQLARFQREAEAAACVSHPRVVGVYDVGRTSDGWSYIACEFLSGTDLDAHIEREGKLELDVALRIGLQICDAIDAAHAQNVIHRDLKPQNVFLLSDSHGVLPPRPQIKVVDFGLSRFLDHADAQLTKTGVVMGTPAFMAPEQAQGKRGDHRVDIYGIGAILYAALTGKAPFEEETLHATLLSVIVKEPERPRALNPEIPEPLELILQRAMAKNPDERYANASELKKALAAYLSTAEEGPSTIAPRPSRNSTGRSSRLLLDQETFELRMSRPRLLFLTCVSVALLIAFLGSALSGLELFVGRLELTRTELSLFLLGIAGTLSMPALLGILHFKKKVWTNSAKVLDLLDAIRVPLFTALVAYALASIWIRFADEFVSRFGFQATLGPSPGIAFPGFTWILPGIAGLTASASFARRKWSEGDIPQLRRHLLGAPLLGVTILLGFLLVSWGFDWRAAHLSRSTAPEEKAAPIAELPSPQPSASPAPLPAEKPAPIPRATDDELAVAIDEGLDGLLPLSEKYPQDPNVLEPLVLAFASRATSYTDALAVAQRLIAVAPEKIGSEALHLLVKRAAQTPGHASALAFELMTENLEGHGADLLYELSLIDPKGKESAQRAKDQAIALLTRPEIRARFSPALRVASELRKTSSCAEKVPLLPRAKSLGDERVVTILAPLATGSKKGCGKWKAQPCPAACADESAAYWETIRSITARRQSTRL